MDFSYLGCGGALLVGMVVAVFGFGTIAVIRGRKKRRAWDNELLNPQYFKAHMRADFHDEDVEAKAVAALRQADPGFSAEALRERCRQLFALVEDAGQQGSLARAGPWLSDSLREALQVRRALGLPAPEPLTLCEARVAGHEIAERYQAVQVQLTAADPAGEKRTLFWSLLRRTGAASRRSLVEGRCPGCNAPLALNAQERCAHCDAVVNSGEFDWLLAESTLGADRLRQRPALADFARVREADPALSAEALASRAGFVFWRWVRAQALSQPASLVQVASRALVSRDPAGRPELAVAGLHRVRLASSSLVLLDEQDGLHRAHVEVGWTLERAGEPVRTERDVFVLQRPAAARTPARQGLSAARCKACSGPLKEDGQARCGWCGADLLDDWVLGDVQAYDPWAAWFMAERRRVVGKDVAGADAVVSREVLREDVLRALVWHASADGRISPGEKFHLERRARALGLAPELFARILAEARTFDVARFPPGGPGARMLVDETVDLEMLNGKLSDEGKFRLEKLARSLRATEHLAERLRPILKDRD